MGVKALRGHDTFAMVMKKDVPKDDVCFNGRFACDIKHNPLNAGHIKRRNI